MPILHSDGDEVIKTINTETTLHGHDYFYRTPLCNNILESENMEHVLRPVKIGKSGNTLLGYFVILTEKIKKYIREKSDKTRGKF